MRRAKDGQLDLRQLLSSDLHWLTAIHNIIEYITLKDPAELNIGGSGGMDRSKAWIGVSG